ncbi:MAG: hypothetical protein HYV35_00975 [Lentisphaerae bacterium]|nr:hypothetical protein [Lentisphaerota bacterium]
MKTGIKLGLSAILVVAALGLWAPAAEELSDVPPRLANGTVIEGTVQEATPEGLVIQRSKGKYTVPWKHLSAGTRYRYERPMFAAQEAARTNALKKTAGAAKPAVKTTAPAGK